VGRVNQVVNLPPGSGELLPATTLKLHQIEAGLMGEGGSSLFLTEESHTYSLYLIRIMMKDEETQWIFIAPRISAYQQGLESNAREICPHSPSLPVE